jgi:hypothetical protein
MTQNPHAARCQWLTPLILATQEAEVRKITVQSQPKAKSSQDPTQDKKGWVVEHLPNRSKALSSNQNTTENKNPHAKFSNISIY